jgi:hypothetical protein
MLLTHLGVALLTLFFYLRSRVAILAAFHDFGTELPRSAAVALSAWFLPSALALSAVAALIGLVAPLRRRQRAACVGFGLFVSSAALVYAVLAAFRPLFQAD